MNNSFLAIESVSFSVEDPVDRTENLREREGELLSILDALEGIASTKEWSTLKEKIFDGITESLSSKIQAEGKKTVPDPLVLNRLAGQLLWAEKYSDLSKLGEIFRSELKSVRTKLHAQKD